ncbi:hypothetical protein RRF57_004313 [Xylaria bambusicola]|uniref:Uncharacterized protein n=1 Tax=Xylaria bambusicola TaxID=326684 RepID=A0AAN7Z6C7_9PEZI
MAQQHMSSQIPDISGYHEAQFRTRNTYQVTTTSNLTLPPVTVLAIIQQLRRITMDSTIAIVGRLKEGLIKPCNRAGRPTCDENVLAPETESHMIM